MYPYAIEYAEKYCVLYNQNYAKFSNNGKKWVDEVRGCLQKSLSKMMTTQEFLSIVETNGLVCRHIQDHGFDSHVPCYLNPTNISKDISICNLDCSDLLIVVDTIKSAFIPFVGQFWQSFLGILSVSGSCLSDKMRICQLDNLENWFKSKAFKIRSQLIQEIDDLKQTSEELANYVAEKFKLGQKNYNWIGYQWSIIGTKNLEYSYFECRVLIVDISNENNNSLDFKIDSIDFFNELMIEGIKVESVYDCDSLSCKHSSQVVNGCEKVILNYFFIVFILIINFI